jgi:hypothetical protein
MGSFLTALDMITQDSDIVDFIFPDQTYQAGDFSHVFSAKKNLIFQDPKGYILSEDFAEFCKDKLIPMGLRSAFSRDIGQSIQTVSTILNRKAVSLEALFLFLTQLAEWPGAESNISSNTTPHDTTEDSTAAANGITTFQALTATIMQDLQTSINNQDVIAIAGSIMQLSEAMIVLYRAQQILNSGNGNGNDRVP